jgi:integrase
MSDKVLYVMYDDDEVLKNSAKQLVAKGVKISEVFSPFPIHGIDPIIGVKKYKTGEELHEIFTKEEAKAIIQSTSDKNSRLMFIFMIYLGLRRGEIVKIQMKDFEDGQRLLVHGKGNRERSLKLPSFVYEEFLKYLEEEKHESDYLFVSSRGKHQITTESVRLRIKKMALESGMSQERVDKISAHTTRRTFACWMLEQNVNPENLSKAMGHSNYEITKRYTKNIKVNTGVDNILENQINLI